MQLCLLVLSVAAVLLAARAYAAVSIARVDISQKSDAAGVYVEFEWETATESETVLFFIQRVEEGQSFPSAAGNWHSYTYGPDVIFVEYENQSIQEIVALGSVSSGAEYTVLDRTVEVGKSYKYRLVEVDLEGIMTPQDSYVRGITITKTHYYYFPVIFN